MLKLFIKYVLYLIMVFGVSSVKAGVYEDFFKAVNFNDGVVVQGLLARGFDPNSRDEKGQSPLYLAMRQGSFKVAEVLLKHPELRQDLLNAAGESAMMMAALKGHLDWVKRLLDRGARIEGLEPRAWTALHYAATGPEPQSVTRLLERGADVNAKSPNGSTPLMMAAQYGPEDSVKILLARGADVSQRNQRDLRAVDFARQAGRESLTRMLDRLSPR